MTYVELTTRLALYLQAEAGILSGSQEYQIGNGSSARRFRKADLAEIRAEISKLQAQIDVAPDNPGARRRRPITYMRMR